MKQRRDVRVAFGESAQPWWTFLSLLAAALAALYPCVRASLHAEVGYNEGWNVYAAMRLLPGAGRNALLPGNLGASPLAGGCCEPRLYPPGYGWTTVNYPAGSFFLIARLFRVTHDLLFTGRVVSLVSLLLSCVLVAALAIRLGANRRAALLGGALLLSIFCLSASGYVGMNDPQVLGQAISLTGVLAYLWSRSRLSGSARGRASEIAGIAFAAVLFVIAGCVKQNLIAFPLAVFLDLLIRSRSRAAWFAVCGVCFAGAAIRWNIRVGGPWFLPQLLLARSYSGAKALLMLRDVFGPLLLPLVLACLTAWRSRCDGTRRFAGLALVCSLVTGGYFAGGAGVARNALFDAFCAVCVLIGLALTRGIGFSGRVGLLGSPERSKALALLHEQRRAAPPAGEHGKQVGVCGAEAPLLHLALLPALLVWMAIPALVEGTWRPWRELHECFRARDQFTQAVHLLRAQPGPALCESLLLCAESGKPFVYDPFNATRLIALGKLSPDRLVVELQQRRYGAVQLRLPLPGDELTRDRFAPEVLQAIGANYDVAWQGSESVVLLPKGEHAQ